MKTAIFIFGLLFLITAEVLKTYFIIPFPHSQFGNSLGLCYFINMNIWWLRLAGLLIIIYPLWQLWHTGGRWKKRVLLVTLALYAGVLYLSNYQFAADKIFEEPLEKQFVGAKEASEHNGQLVIGVVNNGEAKAYPVSVVSFHHQVKDTVGGKPVIITYCSFCRAGKVYSPFINGQYTTFRLVGMSNFNSIFEDDITKSWWRQASGQAVTGKLKGTRLDEVPSEIMYLGRWFMAHPKSTVMMPDWHFLKEYHEFNTGKFKIY